MFDNQDEELGPVLMLVIGIAIVVSLFTTGVALSLTGVFSGTASESAAPQSTSSDAIGTLKIYFAVGSSTLPEGSGSTLFPLTVAAVIDPGKQIEVLGYHDASGDPEQNVALAKARAASVRDALVAAGIARDRIVMQKPVEVLGGADAEAARRVEVGLR